MSGTHRALAWLFVASLVSVSCGGDVDPPQGSAAETTPAAPEEVRGARILELPSEGSASLPPGHPPVAGEDDPSPIAPPAPGSGIGKTALSWSTPDGWIAETPSSPMRKAQYRVPGPAGDGECVVFYFGPGQGGEPMANARRWAQQFAQPDGTPPEQVLQTSTLDLGDVQVLNVEMTGTYSPMTMALEKAEPRENYMLLGAIAEGPDANWFFKLTGPIPTVRSQRDAFEAMVRSLRRGA